jgi:hypothetical protein
MRLNGDLYEYVATYVDDLCLGMLDPKSFTDTLQKKYNFKLKGTGPIDFHLGQSFSQNDNGEMEISAKHYVDKMIDTYVQLYGEKPRKASSPFEQNDHPEMDDSPFLGQDETQQFQSLIGAMQWAVLIRRLDIATAVMSLSSFRAMPRRGHLERAKQIYGYLRKMKEARIRVLTNEPDYSDYQDPEYDWSSSVYGDVKEIIPMDIPEPKGKYVTLSHYFDANLYHDMVTGRSVTAILHFLNQTLMDWYSKKLSVQNSSLQGLPSIRSSTSERLFVILAFLFKKRATSLGTTRPLSMPHRPHMPNYTRDTMLYHSIVCERQSLPNMLRSSICRANTTLPTFSASTGPMLRYGEQ